jgi:hypothetical protein
MKTLQSYRGFLINEQTTSGGFNPLPGTSDNIKALDEHIKTGMKNKPATIKLNLSLPPNLTKDQSSVDYILSIEGVGYSKDKGVPCIFFPLKFSKPSGGGELPDLIKDSAPAITVKIGDKNFSKDDWSKNKKLFSFTFRLENDQDYRQYPGDKACEGLFKLMLEKKIFEDIGKVGEKKEKLLKR